MIECVLFKGLMKGIRVMFEIYKAEVNRKSVIVSSLTSEQAQSLIDSIATNSYLDANGNEFLYGLEESPDLCFSEWRFSIVLLEPKNPVSVASFVTRFDACQYIRAFDTRLFTKGEYENHKIIYILEEN